MLTYSDATTEYHYVPFNPDLSVWQFVSYTLVPKEAEKTVETVRIVCAYEGNANAAAFDDISLLRQVAQTMTYDEDGNLVSSASTGLNTDTNTYENGNLIQTVTGGNGTFTYTYDTQYTHRLQEVSNGLIKQTHTYDSVGNVTGTVPTLFTYRQGVQAEPMAIQIAQDLGLDFIANVQPWEYDKEKAAEHDKQVALEEKEAEKQRKIENKKRRETLMKMRIDKIRKENQEKQK